LEVHPEAHEPSSTLARVGGYVLLWTIAAVVCYAAALVVG
jgi:hypothetical protein